jgi:hypothetical protein
MDENLSDNTVIILALIASAPAMLGGLVAAFVAWLGSRRNGRAIEQVHLSINSRMDELLKAARGEATAEGREAGRLEANTKAEG